MGRARTAVLQRHGTESVAWSGNVRREGMKWGGGQSMVVAEVAGWGIGAWEDRKDGIINEGDIEVAW